MARGPARPAHNATYPSDDNCPFVRARNGTIRIVALSLVRWTLGETRRAVSAVSNTTVKGAHLFVRIPLASSDEVFRSAKSWVAKSGGSRMARPASATSGSVGQRRCSGASTSSRSATPSTGSTRRGYGTRRRAHTSRHSVPELGLRGRRPGVVGALRAPHARGEDRIRGPLPSQSADAGRGGVGLRGAERASRPRARIRGRHARRAGPHPGRDTARALAIQWDVCLRGFVLGRLDHASVLAHRSAAPSPRCGNCFAFALR